MTGCCKGQQLVIIPKTVVPTTAHQIMIWDGSTFKLKELVGFTSSSTQMTIPSAVDGSITNEGLLTLTANPLITGATISSNTSGSTSIKLAGRDGTYILRSATNDTLFFGNNNTRTTFQNHSAVTVSNTTMTVVGGVHIELEDGLDKSFVIYLHYTTGGTSQGLQFRLINNGLGTGTYWYDYNFPITGDRQTGAIYNSSSSITIPSSESGTNIAVIRGVAKSTGVGTGIFELELEISAEDGASTVTTLTTGITQY